MENLVYTKFGTFPTLSEDSDEWFNPIHLAKIKCKYFNAVEGFVLYRSNSKNGTYSKIKQIKNNFDYSYTFTDTGLKSGQTYYYKIRGYIAYNGSTIGLKDSNIIGVKVK